ncbi:MAG: hypothetical protein AAF737_00485 [Pseudomonadota bacterium]
MGGGVKRAGQNLVQSANEFARAMVCRATIGAPPNGKIVLAEIMPAIG